MSVQERILAFSGSARSGSWNQAILKIAIAGARDAGAHVNECALRTLDLPIYDGDLARIPHGLPAARAHRTAITALPSVGRSSHSVAMLRSASVAKYRADRTLRPFATKSHEGSGLKWGPGLRVDFRLGPRAS